MTKFLNISTDNTLGGNSPSNETVSSQKAIKEYVDAHGGGGSTAIDNLSITQNASLQIQTIGVINSRDTSTAVKTWTGTKAQYNAIVSKDANTLYNITDTGEIYMGDTILSNYGANTSLSNLTATGESHFIKPSDCVACHVVVETYVNGTQWYRVYSDGWIEQGGSFNSNSITFLKTFTQKPHFIRSCFSTGGSNSFNYNTANAYFGDISNISTTGVTGLSAFGETLWYACGY